MRKFWKKIFGLRAKTYSYLIGHGSEDKKAKGTRKCVIRQKLKLEDYKNRFRAVQLEKNKPSGKK